MLEGDKDAVASRESRHMTQCNSNKRYSAQASIKNQSNEFNNLGISRLISRKGGPSTLHQKQIEIIFLHGQGELRCAIAQKVGVPKSTAHNINTTYNNMGLSNYNYNQASHPRGLEKMCTRQASG